MRQFGVQLLPNPLHRREPHNCVLSLEISVALRSIWSPTDPEEANQSCFSFSPFPPHLPHLRLRRVPLPGFGSEDLVWIAQTLQLRRKPLVPARFALMEGCPQRRLQQRL